MVPSIIDVWGYDREFCSSSSYHTLAKGIDMVPSNIGYDREGFFHVSPPSFLLPPPSLNADVRTRDSNWI